MTKIFTAYIEYDADTKLYVGIIPAIRGVHTQGATLDELQQNLKEVLELCLEESVEFISFRSGKEDDNDVLNDISLIKKVKFLFF
jgi:predicted RNase H-like HicB family nuclease